VATNASGQYRLAVDDDTWLFVIKPRGYRTRIDDLQIPRYYYIHKPQGSPKLKFAGVAATGELPKSVDFPLYPQAEAEKFDVLFFGDTQPRDQKEIDYIAHDVIEPLIGTQAAFGVSLGDVMFNDLSLYGSLNRAIARLGIPWYSVIGNHDLDFDSENDLHSDETFENVYGPSYYSFNYGPVHFLVLDDVDWVEFEGKRKYVSGLGEEQLAFIKNDLAKVPDEQLVVVMMHIPYVNSTKWPGTDKQQLFRILETRSHCISLAGHTHHHEHRFIGEADGWKGKQPHHQIINGTVCGAWWSGAPDENGIPHTTMSDGTPNGHTVMTFDGNRFRMQYRVARRPASYQMSITSQESYDAAALQNAEIQANIFNAWPMAKVQMRLLPGGDWTTMERISRPDPQFVRIAEWERRFELDGLWMKMPRPRHCPHLWGARLPTSLPGNTYRIEIRAENPDGEVLTGSRLIRVSAEPKEVKAASTEG